MKKAMCDKVIEFVNKEQLVRVNEVKTHFGDFASNAVSAAISKACTDRRGILRSTDNSTGDTWLRAKGVELPEGNTDHGHKKLPKKGRPPRRELQKEPTIAGAKLTINLIDVNVNGRRVEVYFDYALELLAQ